MLTAITESNRKPKHTYKSLIYSYFIITFLDFAFTVYSFIVNLVNF